METDRIKYLDIAKGFGMMFIVWAHANGLFANQFLLVSVGMFFLISGFLHNKTTEFKEFLSKKFFRLYLPFICCNLFLPTIVLIKRSLLNLEIKDNLIYILKIFLTVEKDGFLFGATWFLGSLFLISVTIKALETIIKSDNKHTLIFLITLVLVFISNSVFNFSFGARRTIIGALFYIIGIMLKNHEQLLKTYQSNKWYINTVIMITLILCWNNVNLFKYNNYNILSLILLTITTLIFYVLILKISKFTEIKLLKFSDFTALIGRHSLSILLWQFVFIEIFTAIILYTNGISITMIERLPHVVCKSYICIFLYFIFGLCGPLILTKLYKICISQLFTKQR